MRVVVAGWVNSPHVTAWAAMLVDLDYEVALVGHRAAGWPAVEPPEGLLTFEEFELGSIPIARSYALGRELHRAVERIRPSLVHAHWLPEYGWLAARSGLRPLVSSAWGSDVLGAGALGRHRSRAAIRGADLVLADSAPLADAARRLVPNGPPIEAFHPGVDLDRFAPGDREQARRALGWAPGVPIVLSPRAIHPLYNQGSVIRAFALSRRSLPDARLVLKHPGEAVPPAIAETVRGLGLEEAVDVLGHVDAAAMPLLYRAADVVVSLPSSDSSPATAWEALACARPVVVSDLQWARAELHDQLDAWISPIDDEALAGALETLLTQPDVRERMGAEGRALVQRTRDRRQRMRALDERYRSLVAGR